MLRSVTLLGNVMTSSATTPPQLRARRWMAGYLACMAASVAVVASIGVFARGDGTAQPFVTVRGETVEFVTTGIYAWNPERLVAEGVGWDVFTLFVGVPALLLAIRGVARGSLRWRLFATGMLGYLFYQYLMYAMAWAIGPLLLPFVGIYAASMIGIAWFVSTIPVADLPRQVTDRFPRRGMAVFSGLMALLLLGMWVPMIIEVLRGELTDNLRGQTTLVVQALDLGIVVPLSVATAVLLLRRRPFGYLLAATLVVKGLAMATAIVAMLLSAWSVEGELAVGELVIFGLAAMACLVLLVRMYRALSDEPIPRGWRTGVGDADGTASRERVATSTTKVPAPPGPDS
jgi:hypothetical protein